MTSEAEPGSAIATERIVGEIARLLARPLVPGLHIVATPIGNLGDITLRALTTLAAADVVYCEDTRHSRPLLTHFGIEARLKPYHEHNADQERPRILGRLAAGERVALISDAGTPLISDPGYKLVREAIDAGYAVHAVPGACAAIAALTLAGLPTDAFMFAGFLPVRGGQRQTRLKELAQVPATLIFYEAPTRVAEALADIEAVLGDRACCICRELTKLHEDVRHGTVSTLRRGLGELKGEVVLLLAPATPQAASDDDVSRALAAEMQSSSTRDAVRAVADRLGVARSRVYDLAMALKRDGE